MASKKHCVFPHCKNTMLIKRYHPICTDVWAWVCIKHNKWIDEQEAKRANEPKV